MDTLSFKKLTREDCGSGIRNSYDFVVSGKSLFDLVGAEYGFISLFGDLYYLEHQIILRKQLLLEIPSELESKWVPLYVCPECGDSACGLVSVKITDNGKSITWSDFQYENESWPNEITGEWHELLPDIGPFEFNKKEYRDTLMSLKLNN